MLRIEEVQKISHEDAEDIGRLFEHLEESLGSNGGSPGENVYSGVTRPPYKESKSD